MVKRRRWQQEKPVKEKEPIKEPSKSEKDDLYIQYTFTRDDLILLLVIIWAICMVYFRY
ncbi:MAG: hypothetical protein KC684_07125 [Candidatus Omnitrophica bacterium]|nr:hypothetical protein [Candidatus Omnitrophota bacterium]